MPDRPDNCENAIGSVPEEMVRAQMEQILASDVFSRSERLSNFLRFVVEQALAGQSGSLKEQVLASELYGRSTDFHAATDPVVRVDAGRLRDKLRHYYTEFSDAPVVIALPKGGYVPAFQINPRVASPLTVPTSPTAQPRRPRVQQHFR